MEIALGGVSVKVQPHGLFSPAQRCAETSGDMTRALLPAPRKCVELYFTGGGGRWVARAALLIVEGHLRRRAAHLDLSANLLQARSERFNLLLLFGDRRFLFCSGGL